MFGIKYKPKNLTESLLPILIFNWIVGHQIIQYPFGNFEFFQTIAHSIFALIIYGTCLYFSISCLHEAEWFEHDFSNYLIIVGINVFISTVIIILGWINKNKAEVINIRNLKLDRKLEDLGITVDNKRAYNFSLLVAIVWIASVLMFYLSFYLWSLGYVTVIQMVALIVTQHSMHVNCLVNLTFGLLMRNMALRFRNINQALEKFEIKNNNLSVTNDLLYDNRRVMNNRANLFQDTSSYLNHLLQIFKEAHLELSILCKQITEIFGFQIVMTMTLLLISITSTLYSLYLYIDDTEKSERKLKITLLVINVNSHILNFVFVNHFCSETIVEWKKTGHIFHKLEIKSQGTELCRTIRKFSMQITLNPLTISPCGLIELGYTFIQSFFGTITTYLVILIQMVPPP